MKWGLPARLPFRAKLKQAIPAVLFYLVTDFSMCRYAHFLYIFFPSLRILTAAFTSRSIRFPHSHMYVRSDKASSFFLFPHTLHILLDAKYLSTFIRYFPRSSSLYPSIERNCPYPLSCIPFPKCRPPAIPFRFRFSTHTASYFSARS